MKLLSKTLKHFFFFAFLLLPFSFTLAFTVHAESSVATYDGLLHAIRATQHASQARIEQAAEQEKVRESWETGKLIDEHIFQHKERADYGKQVMKRLSSDLSIDESELYRMVEFGKAYPNFGTSRNLSWNHYTRLLAVNDAQKRKEIEEEAVKEKWSVRQLREEIRKRKLPVSEVPEIVLFEIKPGKVGAYRIFEIAGKKHYDLGFSTFFEIKDTPARDAKISAGSPQTTRDEDLYTYEAQVTQIYDGDTFHAYVNLGFGVVLEQRLRLRALDAAEILSAEGKEAKSALEKALLRGKGKILIKVSKSDDQYGRYLVDVWVKDKSINQELLRSGLFTRREA